MLEKFCVFCGQKPEHKSNEHVIPQWLIEFTGNPKRIAEFGYKDIDNPKAGKRAYSFDNFKFPSCEACNYKHSKLEADAKPLVHKILCADSLSATEFTTLLDWFDKIRIGLWLGYQYLDKNPAGIIPKFYVERRIGLSDRMLAIFKGDGDKEGLNWIGCDMPSFVYTPSCFSLRINNYCFLNMSYNDLFSRRLGFPYPTESFMLEDERTLSTFTKGRNRVMAPILRKLFSLHGTEIYQPMFLDRLNDPIARRFYDTEYVHINSMSWERGIGKVFMKYPTGLQEYPISPSKAWIPSKTYTFEALLFEMQPLTFEWQTYIDGRAPSLERLSKEKRQQVREIYRWNRIHNTKMIQLFREIEKKS